MKQLVIKLVAAAKKDHWCSKIQQEANDQKALFKTIKDLLHYSKATKLPEYENPSEISNRFEFYFIDKVRTIRNKLLKENQTGSDPHQYVTPSDTKLECFEPANIDEISKIIKASPNKQNIADPIPTRLVKECVSELSPTILRIVNKSMESGYVPVIFKQAVVTPLIKKPTLDSENLKNYRPVSNLCYISKVMEKVVAKRLNQYKDSNNLRAPRQSAYRSKHSTETALIKIQNDIIQAMDRGECTILVLLDLSAAFDLVDHDILIKRLNVRFGLCSRMGAFIFIRQNPSCFGRRRFLK